MENVDALLKEGTRIGPPSIDIEVHIRSVPVVLKNGGMTMQRRWEVTIPYPVMRGAVPDWKETAHLLGQKYLQYRYKWNDQQVAHRLEMRTSASLRKDLQEFYSAAAQVRNIINAVHELSAWRKLFLPKWLRTEISDMLEGD